MSQKCAGGSQNGAPKWPKITKNLIKIMLGKLISKNHQKNFIFWPLEPFSERFSLGFEPRRALFTLFEKTSKNDQKVAPKWPPNPSKSHSKRVPKKWWKQSSKFEAKSWPKGPQNDPKILQKITLRPSQNPLEPQWGAQVPQEPQNDPKSYPKSPKI